ncbi:dihydroxyacetone kinase subunit DhaK [Streptomyces mirabilis]|uniref:dihydroxyacetone kinase subunit DhaK n=1 Tax=Streptomyces mirabilis TaxID=68239 RepID=UPI00368495EC
MAFLAFRQPEVAAFERKAVGSAAERGADLDEIHRIGEKVNDVTPSMGMALTACTPPAKGSPLLDPPEDAVEMGVGIYGEPGRKREKLQSAKAMVGELVSAVVDDLSNAERSAEAHQEQADL